MTTNDERTAVLERTDEDEATAAMRAAGAILHFTNERRSTSEISPLVSSLLESTFPGVVAHIWVVRAVDNCSTCPLPEHCGGQLHCLRRESVSRDEDLPAAPYGRGLIGRLAVRRRPIINSRWDESMEDFERTFASARGYVHFSGFPLIAAERFFGVLGVTAARPLEAATAARIDVIAQAAAHAFATAELVEENEMHSARLEARVEQKTIELREKVADMEAIRKGLMNMMSDAYEAHRRLQDLAKNLEQRVADQTTEAVLAKDDAMRANALKSEFLSQVSHELRTPMHGIISYAKVGLRKLEKSSIEKNREFFTQILESAEELLALINELLDLSKIEAGRAQYTFEMQDVAAQIRRLLVFYEPLMREHGMHFELDVAELVQPMAVFDRNRMHQVLTNLLGNAMKFSPKGGTIHLHARNDADDVVIDIADQGPGIPDSELENIFEPFVQGPQTTRTKKSGTGLGLAIARGIVHDHGGTIRAMNATGGGAVFTFRFPASGPKSRT